MSKLPVVSGPETIRALERIGYEVVRHPSDSDRKPVTVPNHAELKAGTLRAILRDANLTVDVFRELLA